jgi:hypothetical protein
MKINLYTIVKYISLFCAPFAPAVFFGSKVYAGLSEVGVGYGLALLAAICAAVALETVGLLAGHTLVDFVGLGRYELSFLSFILLACYVAIGVYELWNTIGAVMFGVALLVYLLVALKQYSDKLDHQKEDKRAEQKEDRQASLQLRKDVEMAKIEAEKLEKQAEIEAETRREIAKIEARKELEIAKIAPQQKVAPAIAEQQIDNKTAILQLHQSGIKKADIARQLGVHPSTVTRTLQNNRVSAD